MPRKCLLRYNLGVNSGLIVNTTADWDKETECFLLNSPNIGKQKQNKRI